MSKERNMGRHLVSRVLRRQNRGSTQSVKIFFIEIKDAKNVLVCILFYIIFFVVI